MERRQFLSWVSVGMLASSLPMVLAACGGSSGGDETASDGKDAAADAPAEEKLDTSIREDGFQALAKVEDVDAGAVVDKVNTNASVMMFRDPDSAELVALNPMCTHQGCTVDFDADAKELSCPCHGSKFALDGAVTNGPAKKPLPAFEVKEEDGLVLVKVS
ncbi:MAG: Rieske (2Fe-2S) protein [Spirulina sp. SIO3F2]|nr:Rieske (2Fe-2S) protein [Spirulina sp. SIO3F2]